MVRPSILVLTFGLGLLACEERQTDLRTWRASDHDQVEEQQRAAAAPAQAKQPVEQPETSSGSPHPRDGSNAAMAMRTWAARCMRCHGQIGTGDGADGESLGMPDLSDLARQDRLTDSEIAQIIVSGKGKMPASALEPSVVTELVALIRRMAARTMGASPEGMPVGARSRPSSAPPNDRAMPPHPMPPDVERSPSNGSE